MEINQSLRDMLLQNPALVDLFEKKGLPSNPEDPRTGQVSLEAALRFKRIDVAAFEREVETYLMDRETRFQPEGTSEDCDLLVRIPCVVQLPVEAALDAYLARHEMKLRRNIALVEFGGHWLRDILEKNTPEVILGAGIEGMLGLEALMKNYCAPDVGPMNSDFSGMEDPKGVFLPLFSVPLVFVVDERQLGGREIPDSFETLLGGSFEKSVVYPDDGHLLDSIMLYYIYSAFGMDGIRSFRKACVAGAHPSQMIKYGGMLQKSAVMIMPHIFASIKVREPDMRMVWPREGAPLLTVMLCVRRDASEEGLKVARFLAGEEIGRIVLSQGLFPSSNSEIDNHLPGKLWFPDWNEMYNAELERLIPRLKSQFLEEEACI